MPRMIMPPVVVMELNTAGSWRNARWVASTVMEPWTTNTLTAEKMTPMPRVEARAMEATPSSSDFRKSVSGLPAVPSWMQPIMVMAPVMYSRVALTNPWTKVDDPESKRSFRYSPMRSTPRSIRRSSPVSAPRRRHATEGMRFSPDRAIFSAMTVTASPKACMMICFNPSLICLPAETPIMDPTTTATVLATVPITEAPRIRDGKYRS
ncbi:MAG: hypothetical protein BWX71_01589 [Deltaproteobacteria bacterium ADurb.Bin072]|nr:MAG: hypothetical protein BWX71_01589 [Deltaproteobacteria bacterium ADurb.Bin072]